MLDRSHAGLLDIAERKVLLPGAREKGILTPLKILFELLIRFERMDAAFGNSVQSHELLGGAAGRGVERGVSSSDCVRVAVDHRYWYRHKLGRIVEGMLSTGIQKFELDTVRWVVEVGGGGGWWKWVVADSGIKKKAWFS